MNTNYNIDVETLQAGQPRSYADSIYHFIITDKSEKPLREYRMKEFCTRFIRTGYGVDKMPTPFSGKILIFKQLEERKWEYKVSEEYTG